MKVYIPVRGPEIEQIYPEYDRFLNDFKNLNDTTLLQKQIDNYEPQYQQIDKITFEVIYSSRFEKKEEKRIKDLSKNISFSTLSILKIFY